MNRPMCVLCGSHDHMADACFWRPGWQQRQVSENTTVHKFVQPSETIDVHITVQTVVTPTGNSSVHDSAPPAG